MRIHKVGILGGGQLARMLTLQGHDLGFQMHVLSENPDDPAALVTSHWHKGKTASISDVKNFCKKMDFVTFESEFIPAAVLTLLHKAFSKKIFPKPLLLKKLQDRLSQKELLIQYGIPTSPFLLVSDSNDLKDAKKLFKSACVVKKRLGGYDGKGTFILKSSGDIKNFLNHHNLAGREFIVESFVSFKRELAVQVARNPRGEILFFPLVEIKQKNNRLDYLVGPVKHKKLKDLQKKIKVFLNAVDYAGVMAFELFDTGNKLIVNEIAPRVHNSGHYTIEALNEDQFKAHLLAGLGQAFSKVEFRSPAFAMTNLIGEGSSMLQLPPDLTGSFHWYGKKQNSPGRKIGHVTYLGDNTKSVLKTALRERKRMRL
jgi:5-(carboxyamino)imidazole ribonucleotide synthase